MSNGWVCYATILSVAVILGWIGIMAHDREISRLSAAVDSLRVQCAPAIPDSLPFGIRVSGDWDERTQTFRASGGVFVPLGPR